MMTASVKLIKKYDPTMLIKNMKINEKKNSVADIKLYKFIDQLSCVMIWNTDRKLVPIFFQMAMLKFKSYWLSVPSSSIGRP